MSTDPAESDLAENPEEIEELPDDDITSEALQTVLEEMTSVYASDDEPIPVKLAGRSAAHPDGDCVFVNPDLPKEMDPPVAGPNILRLVDDLLAHEVAHVNWSDLRAKEKFAECYPGWGKIPGFVENVLEDEYVDAKRKQQWYGMRSKLAYYVWLHMNTDHRAPRVDEVYESEGRTQALMTAFFQTALAGYIKGDTEAIPDDILEFCSYAEVLIKRVRGEDDPDERWKLFHAVMQLLMRYVPEPEEFDPEEMDDRRRESHDGGGDESAGKPEPAPDAEEPSVDLPPELEAGLEDMLEEMLDEGELPEMPEPPESEPGGDEDGADGGESDEGTGGSASSDEEPESPDDESGGGGGDDSDEPASDEEESGDSESDGGDDGEPTDSTDEDGDHDSGISRDISDTLAKYGAENLTVVN